MIFSFDTIVAEEVGVNSAIVFNNLLFWIKTNKANNENFYDGKYWTYNSIKAYAEIFPFFTEKQIRTAIDKLVEADYIIKGEYNKSAYDRTTWYSLSDSKEYLIANLSQTELPLKSTQVDFKGSSTIYKTTNIENKENSNLSKDKLLGDSEVDTKLYSNDKPKNKRKNLYEKCIDEINEYTDIQEIKDALIEYLNFRLSVKDKPLYSVNQWKSMLKKLDSAVEECMREYVDVIRQSLDKAWLNFYPIKENTRGNIANVSAEFGEVKCNKFDGDESRLADESF